MAPSTFPSSLRAPLERPTLESVLSRGTYVPVSLAEFQAFLERRKRAVMIEFWEETVRHERLWKKYCREQEGASDQAGEGAASSRVPVPLAVEDVSKSTGRSTLTRRASSHVGTQLRTIDEAEADSSENVQAGDHEKTCTGLPTHGVSPAAQDAMPHLQQVTRHHLVANALRLHHEYLCTPTTVTARHIALPTEIYRRVTTAILDGHRFDPSIFEEVKAHIYAVLSLQAFPQFLAQAYSLNVVARGAVARFVLGVLLSVLGFAWCVGLILLGRERAIRLAGYPFVLAGFQMMWARQVSFDSIWGILGLVEYAPFRGRRVRDALARHLQRRRGILTMIYQSAITMFLFLPFVLVPAFRL